MAIVETGAIFNSLIFGGINSVDYGVYITGEAVYNAPVRAVEMVYVPNRNGAIGIDQGYWENVEVRYPAGCFGSTQAEFAEAIARFRNAIVTQLGYQRLTDTYHPEEYRMASYISGLEVEAVNSGVAGEFELVFNAKPQRFLITGEERTVITTSGATMPNPTLNNSSPMLEVEGYGTLTVNGYEIDVENAVLGDITLLETTQNYGTSPTTSAIPVDYLNSGDTIYLRGLYSIWETVIDGASEYQFPENGTATITESDSNASTTWIGEPDNANFYRFKTSFPDISFTLGTSSSYQATTTIAGTTYYQGIGTSKTLSTVYTTTVAYDASTQKITCSFSAVSTVQDSAYTVDNTLRSSKSSAVVGSSTLSILGHPTYIDCDLGVCYKIENDTVIDLNSYIDLGSDLPVLASGANTVTFDNTITSVGVLPRWWII